MTCTTRASFWGAQEQSQEKQEERQEAEDAGEEVEDDQPPAEEQPPPEEHPQGQPGQPGAEEGDAGSGSRFLCRSLGVVGGYLTMLRDPYIASLFHKAIPRYCMTRLFCSGGLRVPAGLIRRQKDRGPQRWTRLWRLLKTLDPHTVLSPQ